MWATESGECSHMANKVCAHCGGTPADLFANDGSAVCDRCFAYDQVVAGELRVSQHKYGMQETGDATTLVAASRKAGRNELLLALAVLAGAITLFVLSKGHELYYFGAGILGLIGLILLGQAILTLRFSATKAPEIVRRASTAPPPAMPPGGE
jgi:hypothetical protein